MTALDSSCQHDVMTNNLTIVGTYGTGDKVITLKMVQPDNDAPSNMHSRSMDATLLARFLRENLPLMTLTFLAAQLNDMAPKR